MNQPSTSVVIPTWQRVQALSRCLRSLMAQECPPSEIIVVGRPEDTPTKQLVQNFIEKSDLTMRWVDVEREGFTAPIQVGAAAAHNDVIAFLDDDTEAEGDWLLNLLSPFKDPRVACVGGPMVDSGEDKLVRPSLRAGTITKYGKYVGQLSSVVSGEAREVDGVREGNWAWRRTILDSLEFDRLFDLDDALHYGLDLCLQAKRKGFRVVFTPQARVIHYHAPRPGGVTRQNPAARNYIHGRNLTWIGLKHYRGLPRVLFPLWWLLIGERQSYGLLKGIYDLLREGPRVIPLMGAALRGRFWAIREWRKSRVSGRGSHRFT